MKTLRTLAVTSIFGFLVLGCVSDPVLTQGDAPSPPTGVVGGLTAHLTQYARIPYVPLERLSMLSRDVGERSPSVLENPAGYTHFEKTIDNPAGPLNVLDPEDPIVRDARVRGIHWPMVANAGSSFVYPRQKGRVSYYHEDQSVATGEDYDPGKLTAAHKSLPFGTIVRCTRVDTGQSVVVMINDRGPYVRGRVLDLSRCAARQLDLINDGVATCQIEVLAYPLIETMGPRGNG